ncbi:MAG: hypothetical protein J2P26_00585 [Nocardiopsaceae bacterium]|nr:hypothetical protein [Nocardiopsaceae bacterium]
MSTLPAPQGDDDEGDALTLNVESQPTPGGYTVTVHFGPDRSRSLTRAQCRHYAHAVLTSAEHAVYAAAIYQQVTAPPLEMPTEQAREFVGRVRGRLALGERDATAPAAFIPGVNGRVEPFIRVEIDGRPVGQLTPADARGHAHDVLYAVHAAAADTAYRRYLVAFGLDDAMATHLVQELAEHRCD